MNFKSFDTLNLKISSELLNIKPVKYRPIRHQVVVTSKSRSRRISVPANCFHFAGNLTLSADVVHFANVFNCLLNIIRRS